MSEHHITGVSISGTDLGAVSCWCGWKAPEGDLKLQMDVAMEHLNEPRAQSSGEDDR